MSELQEKDLEKELQGKDYEDDLYDRIRESVEQEPVPDSLKPENVEKMLSKRRPKKKKWIYAVASAAAILVVGFIGIIIGFTPGMDGIRENWSNFAKGSNEDKAAYTENVTALADGFSQAKSYEEVENLLFQGGDTIFDEISNLFAGAFNMADGAMTKSAYDVAEEDYESLDSQDDFLNESDMDYENTVETEEKDTDYSKTNVQEEGIDEADVMVTDGKYIYRATDSGEIIILHGEKHSGKLEIVSRIENELSGYGMNMYLYGNKLVVVGNEGSEAKVHTYDISNKENPSKKGEITVTGRYEDSRINDGILYLFAKYSSWDMEYGNHMWSDCKDVIPRIQEEIMAVEDIYYTTKEEADGYLIGISVDLEEPDEVQEKIAVLVNSSEFYVSENSIYIAESQYSDYTKTDIYKLSYQDGHMKPAAKGTIKGTIDDCFSMNEYKGYLRVVTTGIDYDTFNNLYVLDEKLKITGKIEHLAPGERIYSARFMKDTGYFVTYRQVDPLFSVDLSNPSKPVVLGELKISGFSQYLHPYGKNLLLGMGWETRVQGTGTQTLGMKLSMFDTTDKSNVTESHKFVLENVENMSLETDGHHGILIDVEKNIFGVAVETWQGYNMSTSYCTFRYVEKEGFVKTTETLLGDNEGCYGVRAAYIGDILYIGTDRKMMSVSLADGKILDEVFF